MTLQVSQSYRQNHYVPQWYQRGFLPSSGEMKFHYLDLRPDQISIGNGKFKPRNSLKRWGTERCFFEKDLYTTRFGQHISTEIEEKFFGQIDGMAPAAVSFFSNFTHPEYENPLFYPFMKWMSLQKLRTPKGLAHLKSIVNSPDPNQVLYLMQRIQDLYCATWSESVWQVVDSSASSTQFILSDHPVTVYNYKCFPGSPQCNGVIEPDIRLAGTHTLAPLSRTRLLILTNLYWARNPYQSPLNVRPNPGLFRPTLFSFLEVQTHRLLTEDEVRRINFIIKQRAHRYVAAAEEDWLYPERHLKQTGWYALAANDLLMPDPRSMSFSREMLLGYENGRTEGYDEYGRQRGQRGFADDALAAKEHLTFQKFQGEFAKRHGPKRRGRTYNFHQLDPEEDSADMHRYYASLLKKPRRA